MRKIKIAHILHSVGGVDVSLRLITENIDAEKFENIIIHGFKDTQTDFLDRNKQVVRSYKTSIFRNINLMLLNYLNYFHQNYLEVV